jgi:hypothetical protein
MSWLARADLRHHRHQMLAGDQASDPRRQMERRLGADDLRECRKPLPDLGGMVVHDVVDAAGLAMFERLDRSCRGVLYMDERSPTRAVPD